MVEVFAYSLAETVTRITDRSGEDLFSATYDGLLLLIDEADNACSDLELGSFIKLLVEQA